VLTVITDYELTCGICDENGSKSSWCGIGFSTSASSGWRGWHIDFIHPSKHRIECIPEEKVCLQAGTVIGLHADFNNGYLSTDIGGSRLPVVLPINIKQKYFVFVNVKANTYGNIGLTLSWQ